MGFSNRALVPVGLVLVAACGSGPSKSDALQAINKDAKTDALCTLPIEAISSLKNQYSTKATCIPKDLAVTARVKSCMDALVAAKLSTPMSAAYMREWPDDVAAKSLSDLPAYDRKAREVLYAGCWSIDEHLRQGQFVCAKATPEKVLDQTKVDDAHYDVKYMQTLAPIDTLGEIDKACAGVTKPPSDVTVRLEKSSAGWSVAPSNPVIGK